MFFSLVNLFLLHYLFNHPIGSKQYGCSYSFSHLSPSCIPFYKYHFQQHIYWISVGTRHRSDSIPYLFLNTPHGVSYTEENSTSKVNPTNAVVAVNLARKMISDKLWQLSEITIIILYRAQASIIRGLLRTLRVGSIDNQVEVSTVDAIQARENQYVIFEPTIASIRDKRGFSHAIDSRRLCVALSRAQNIFVIIADVHLPRKASTDEEIRMLRYISG